MASEPKAENLARRRSNSAPEAETLVNRPPSSREQTPRTPNLPKPPGGPVPIPRPQQRQGPGQGPQRPRPNYEDNPEIWRHSFRKKPKGSWHTNTTVDWHEKWTEDSWLNGRVLVIDYMRHEEGSAAKTRVAAQEIQDPETLRKFYGSKKRSKQSALRLIHVQNAQWAVHYFCRKYNIDSSDDLVGMDFSKWAKYAHPEWRAGKPLLKGRTWRTQRDPWRGVRRTAFGLDYLKPCEAPPIPDGASQEAGAQNLEASPSENEAKMMELNCYDDADNAAYGWDLYVQRISCYVQFSEGEPTPPENVKNPYPQKPPFGHRTWDEKHLENGDKDGQKEDCVKKPHLPPLEWLDNGNTIIIFELSNKNSVTDTLIGARQQIESRWRRLSFYLPQRDLTDDSRLAKECTDLILEDLFKGLVVSWDSFLNVCETHINILEDKIYESPADESRAPELWYNSSAWLKVEKLAIIHVDLVKEVINNLGDLSDDTDRDWLDGVPEQFDKVVTLVQEDLVKPTDNMGDLMYKSVGIRDSRESLQLGLSMWRLSWITFIFLPLTFIVGFFGMNVDTFQSNPSIKWYFISAVPLMLLVLVLWYFLKHSHGLSRQTPYQRGVYEHLFYDLTNNHPQLWSRNGPRRNVQPRGVWSRIRWRLLTYWFDPRKTIQPRRTDPDEDVGGSGLGVWARVKRSLARRWLGRIDAETFPLTSGLLDEDVEEYAGLMDSDADANVSSSDNGGAAGPPGPSRPIISALGTTPVVAAQGLPEAATIPRITSNNDSARLSPPIGSAPVSERNAAVAILTRGRGRSPRGSGSHRSSTSPRPSSSGQSSGYMVEEIEMRPSSTDDIRAMRDGMRSSIDAVFTEGEQR